MICPTVVWQQGPARLASCSVKKTCNSYVVCPAGRVLKTPNLFLLYYEYMVGFMQVSLESSEGRSNPVVEGKQEKKGNALPDVMCVASILSFKRKV